MYNLNDKGGQMSKEGSSHKKSGSWTRFTCITVKTTASPVRAPLWKRNTTLGGCTTKRGFRKPQPGTGNSSETLPTDIESELLCVCNAKIRTSRRGGNCDSGQTLACGTFRHDGVVKPTECSTREQLTVGCRA